MINAKQNENTTSFGTKVVNNILPTKEQITTNIHLYITFILTAQEFSCNYNSYNKTYYNPSKVSK